MRICFSINRTILGECYFRVSEHLGKPISWVILKKFTPDVKLLLNKYYNIIVQEQKEYEKIKEMEAKMPSI